MTKSKVLKRLDAMRDRIEDGKKRILEFEKTDSKEARYRAGALKRHIGRWKEEYNNLLHEEVLKQQKINLRK